MAIGKTSKKAQKLGPKKGKKKTTDPFLKKEWFVIRSPSMFPKRSFARTLVTKSQGTKIASEGLKNRVVTMSLGELNDKTEDTFRKFSLQIEDVQGNQCLTSFKGMSLTTDKMCSMVKKWQSTIECFADVKTTDNFHLRVFVIAFTKKAPTQLKKHTYAQAQQIKSIRGIMREVIENEIGSCDIKEVVRKLSIDSIGKDITKKSSYIFPLTDCCVRKVKVIRKPKMDLAKLMDLHGESVGVAATGAGEITERPDGHEPPVQTSV